MALLLAIDLGTEGARVAAYDPDTATPLGDASAPYATTHPQPAWAEQDPIDWWAAVVAATRTVLDEVGSTEVDAIAGAATSSTVVTCTADGRPLRPAILWMDARATRETAHTATIDHPVLRYSGGADAVEWLVPKAMWLAANEPDTYADADVIAEQIDFLNHRLTGRWTGSRLNATCKWNYDPERPGFDPALFEAFGVPDLVDKLPAEIVAVGDPVGQLTDDAAAALGISTRPLVAQGGIDAHVAMLGAATLDAGELLMVAGTSVVHLTHASRPVYSPAIWGPYPDALVPGLWIVEGGQVSGGAILRWITDRLLGLDDEGHRALLQEATAAPACQLLALDHWMGNRTPYRDADLRGAFVGMTLGHGPATLYRAVAESIALGSANVVDSFRAAGLRVDHVVVAGGVRSNPLWLQLSADALGMPLHLTRDPNLSLVAGAVAGAVLTGRFPDLPSAARAFVSYDHVVEPDPTMHACLVDQLDRYRRATEALAPLMHELSRPTDLPGA